MPEDRGWIKIHRELLDKPIWQLSTPEQKVILITLLLMANHKEKKWEWNGKQFLCQAGQFVTSLDKIAEKSGAGISIKNVRTAIARFEKLGFLANESTKTGRLITIVNWDDYQLLDKEGGKDTGKDLAKSRQRPGKDLATNKNVKNDKNERMEEKNNIIVAPEGTTSPKYPTDCFEMKCVEQLIQSCLESFPKSRVPKTDVQKEKWADEIEKMKRLDGLSEQEIKEALCYTIGDNFWKTNIRSIKKFREKFEVLITQSRNGKDRRQVSPMDDLVERLNRMEESYEPDGV